MLKIRIEILINRAVLRRYYKDINNVNEVENLIFEYFSCPVKVSVTKIDFRKPYISVSDLTGFEPKNICYYQNNSTD